MEPISIIIRLSFGWEEAGRFDNEVWSELTFVYAQKEV